jgi:phosphonate transport system substrate-binding protein
LYAVCVFAGLLCVLGPWGAVVAAGHGPFRLGVINERPEKPDHALSQYGTLHAYLATELAARGVQVGELVITRSIDEMADRIASGDVDGLVEGVMPSLSIQRRTGNLDPALLAWRKGQRQYHTVFFVRHDSPIVALPDLAGKTIAFEAPRSTSAYFVPRATLVDAGMPLVTAANPAASADAVRYVFAGSELNQAYWVHRGRADVAAFNNGDWDRVPEHLKKDLRLIHTTRPMLRWLLSFRGGLDAATRAAVTDVLVHAHETEVGRVALEAAAGIARFEPLMDNDREGLVYWADVLQEL